MPAKQSKSKLQKRKAKHLRFPFFNSLNAAILHQINRFPHITHTDQADISTVL